MDRSALLWHDGDLRRRSTKRLVGFGRSVERDATVAGNRSNVPHCAGDWAGGRRWGRRRRAGQSWPGRAAAASVSSTVSGGWRARSGCAFPRSQQLLLYRRSPLWPCNCKVAVALSRSWIGRGGREKGLSGACGCRSMDGMFPSGAWLIAART